MVQKFSFHMHTSGFDGQNTEEEMLKKAKEQGLEQIGFSNHFIVYPNIEKTNMYPYAVKGGYSTIYSSDFDEAIAKFVLHYQRIDELNKNSDIKIYKGMEVDFFASDEWRKGFERALKILKPDYVIGAAHFVEYKNTLYNSHDLKNATPTEQNKLVYRYWQNVRAAAESGLFDFMAHLDLIKKVGLGREEKWEEEEQKAVAAIKKSATMAEINTSHFYYDENEPYPSKRIMKMLAEYDVPVLLSDDAHKKENITAGFAKAEAMAKECGIKNFTNPLEGKKISYANLPGKDNIYS